MIVILPTRRLRPLIARILIAATLTVALVSGITPLGSMSSGSLCTMSCCAGEAPHEAGSCTHGSCNVNFASSKPLPPPSPPIVQEELCRATKPLMTQHGDMHAHDAPAPANEDLSTADHQHHQPADSLVPQDQSPQNKSRQLTNIAASVLTKPCPPDCGAGTFSYSSQTRPRDSASVSYADKPRPPSILRLRRIPDNVAKSLEALRRRSRPRGPPISFS